MRRIQSRFVAYPVGACCLLLAMEAAAQQPPAGALETPVRIAQPAPVRGAASLAGPKSSRLATIQGNALDAQNGALTSGLVRLRDARFGRATLPQSISTSGVFEFRGVEPGTYVVELVEQNTRVLAASPLVSADAGQVVSTLVRMPYRIPAVGVTGEPGLPQAIGAVLTAAASAGVLTSAVPDACVSGPCH